MGLIEITIDNVPDEHLTRLEYNLYEMMENYICSELFTEDTYVVIESLDSNGDIV
jgi:hypothetical protein